MWAWAEVKSRPKSPSTTTCHMHDTMHIHLQQNVCNSPVPVLTCCFRSNGCVSQTFDLTDICFYWQTSAIHNLAFVLVVLLAEHFKRPLWKHGRASKGFTDAFLSSVQTSHSWGRHTVTPCGQPFAWPLSLCLHHSTAAPCFGHYLWDIV